MFIFTRTRGRRTKEQNTVPEKYKRKWTDILEKICTNIRRIVYNDEERMMCVQKITMKVTAQFYGPMRSEQTKKNKQTKGNE